MTDFIREIQATVSDLNDRVFCTLYEHKESNLFTMVLHHGIRYTVAEVQSWEV